MNELTKSEVHIIKLPIYPSTYTIYPFIKVNCELTDNLWCWINKNNVFRKPRSVQNTRTVGVAVAVGMMDPQPRGAGTLTWRNSGIQAMETLILKVAATILVVSHPYACSRRVGQENTRTHPPPLPLFQASKIKAESSEKKGVFITLVPKVFYALA